MEFNKFKNSFFSLLSSLNLEIKHHALYQDEVSELYVNEIYVEGEEEKFFILLEKQFKIFKRELGEKINTVSDSLVFLRLLSLEVLEMKEQFEDSRKDELATLNNYKIKIPTQKIKFVSDIREAQQSFQSKLYDYLSDLLSEINPQEFSQNSDFKLNFNLSKKEVILLFIILEEANILQNSVSSNKTRGFIEKHFQYKGIEGGKTVYKSIEGISSLLPKFKDGQAPYEESINYLKDSISAASVEERFNISS